MLNTTMTPSNDLSDYANHYSRIIKRSTRFNTTIFLRIFERAELAWLAQIQEDRKENGYDYMDEYEYGDSYIW